MELYANAGTDIATIREYGEMVPGAGVLALLLAITHCELESVLWQVRSVNGPVDGLQAVLDRHRAAVRALRLSATSILTAHWKVRS